MPVLLHICQNTRFMLPTILCNWHTLLTCCFTCCLANSITLVLQSALKCHEGRLTMTKQLLQPQGSSMTEVKHHPCLQACNLFHLLSLLNKSKNKHHLSTLTDNCIHAWLPTMTFGKWDQPSGVVRQPWALHSCCQSCRPLHADRSPQHFMPSMHFCLWHLFIDCVWAAGTAGKRAAV